MTASTSRITALVVAAACSAATVLGQAPPAEPVFEVASVKPNRSGDQGASIGIRPGGQVVVTNNTLRNIVRNVYGIQNYQIVGGPDWFDRDRFDIVAKAGDPNATPEQLQTMARRLLADRFKLVVHFETREVPVYALVVQSPGRFGPQMRPAAFDCSTQGAGPPPAGTAIPAWPPNRPLCGTRTTPGRLIAGGVLMADLARNISNFAGRLTTDDTGLTERFDLFVEWTPDQLPPPGQLPPGLPAPPTDAPDLFTAVQEQLGLRLDSRRAPADVLVIDSASQPTPD
jgi:uncharacterized protein (TIGR03435 family)